MPDKRVYFHSYSSHNYRTNTIVIVARPMHHYEKYPRINNTLTNKQRQMPYFTRSNYVDLIHTIQAAGGSNGRNGLFLCGRAIP